MSTAANLSARSQTNLKSVHPDMIAVVVLAYDICPVKFTVIEGVRAVSRQHELYGQGRTASQLRQAGVDPRLAKPKMPIVTWTLKSNHFPNRDGLGEAVDLANVVGKEVRWQDAAIIAEAMLKAAKQLGIPVRWGKDWNGNGKPGENGEADGPHFELLGARRVANA